MSGPLVLLALTLALDGAAALRPAHARSAGTSRRTPSRAVCAPISHCRACCGCCSLRPCRTAPHRGERRPSLARRSASGSPSPRWSSISSPPLAVVNALVGRRSAPPCSPATHTLIGGIAALSLVIGRLQRRRRADHDRRGAPAAASRRTRRARRCASSTSSRTAAAAGSGKPITRAPCPTSRSSWPTTSSASREALLGRQFTDLAVGRHQHRRRSARRARPWASICRRASHSPTWSCAPASDEDVHWSLSGNPIFDERGRFLGFRGIGTDLTEQRRSEQEISRLARFDSLTGLPNRALMRQTLDEALRNAARRQKGCALVPDRPRPLQERQRHARPPDRRRAAAPGRRSG